APPRSSGRPPLRPLRDRPRVGVRTDVGAGAWAAPAGSPRTAGAAPPGGTAPAGDGDRRLAGHRADPLARERRAGTAGVRAVRRAGGPGGAPKLSVGGPPHRRGSQSPPPTSPRARRVGPGVAVPPGGRGPALRAGPPQRAGRAPPPRGDGGPRRPGRRGP